MFITTNGRSGVGKSTTIQARISARGPRNRFHLDPTTPGREVLLY
ncbi:hypothetical protein ACIP3U_13090 [[Kitasatospora] papulosa]|nr:hypothetical protein [Streptomyces sp. FT05W]